MIKYYLVEFLIKDNSTGTCSRWFLAGGFFCPEDGGDAFFRNVGSHKIYMAPHPRRRHFYIFLILKNIKKAYEITLLAVCPF
jgi:hypothetical protein